MKHPTKQSRKVSMKQKQTITKGDVAQVKATDLTPKILKVKQGLKFRGARQSWYETLLAHDGKSEAEYIKVCTDKPPSVPKSGKAEKPSGWLSFFKRTGAVSLADG